MEKRPAPTMWVHELEEKSKAFLEQYEDRYDVLKPEVQEEIRLHKGILNLLKISRDFAVEVDKLKSPEFQNSLFCAVVQGYLSGLEQTYKCNSQANAENIMHQYTAIVDLKLKAVKNGT